MRALARAVLSALGLMPAVRRVRELQAAHRQRASNARLLERLPPGELPIPPARLIYRVAATADVAWFLEAGTRAAASIRSALASVGVRLEDLGAVLDFGCGCGRVVRHWKHLPARIHGTDLNAGLVSWCRRHLRFASFSRNALDPPLAYGDDAFDLAYALSVFTHLDERRQRAWIGELRRVVRPGGHLLLTTHGRRYRDELPPDLAARFDAGELAVRHAEDAGSNVCGAYHPEGYVRGTLAAGWEVAAFVPEGALGNPHQDLWLLRKPAP
jgi:SAM-dependent methyltransferase